jgi:accessory gene regulator B
MLENLAKSTARFFVSQNIVKSEYEDIYAYGMEILLSTVINGVIVLFIAILSDTVLPSLLFFTAFILMRRSAGGYHAKTHIGCMMILIAVHLMFMVLINVIPDSIIPILSYFSIAYSCISVYLFAPVEHPNKPLSSDDRRKLRVKSLIYILSISVVDLFMIFCAYYDMSLCLSCGIIVSTTGMLAEIISLRLENINEET